MFIEITMFILYIIELIVLDKILSPAERKFTASLNDFFLVSLVAYSVLPVASCIVNGEEQTHILTFQVKCMVIVISIMVGSVIGRSFSWKRMFSKIPTPLMVDGSLARFLTISFGFFCIILTGINIAVNRGGLANFFNSTYRGSVAYVTSNAIGALMYAIPSYVLVFSSKRIILDKQARVLSYIFSFGFILLGFIGGNRNYAVMITIALLWNLLDEKRIRKPLVYGLIVLAVVFLGLVAVYREYGIMNSLKGNVSLNWENVKGYIFSFQNGELGTTMAFEKYRDRIVPGYSYPFTFGFTYTIVPILSLVPRDLWPTRPMGPADYFSHYAFGGFDETGYGYSPIYEAESNFGPFWWITFVAIGILLVHMERKTDQSVNDRLNAGLICCVILNFYRIDFSTCFKFFAMMWCFKWLYVTCICSFSNCRSEMLFAENDGVIIDD